MLVLADADGRERGLREAITAQLPEELVMQSWVYTQGLNPGIEQGLRMAIEHTLTARGVRLTDAHRARLAAEARIDVLQTSLTRAATAERAVDVFTAVR